MVNLKDYQGVVVLYNDLSPLSNGEQIDQISEQDVINCARGIYQALQTLTIPAELVPFGGDLGSVLAPYPPSDWIIYNLAEGGGGRLYEEARIAWSLETMGYCFTGSSGRAIALTSNKTLTKFFLSRAGLKTPDWWLYHSPDQIPLDGPFSFPLFVKPAAEDASLGIGKDSVVRDVRTLRDRAAYIIDHYHQSALVEEFIPGRELHAAVWGDPQELLPITEIDFSSFPDAQVKIVDYAAKWQQESFEFQHTPSICPVDLPPGLEKKISRSSLCALQTCGVHAYARVDFRLAPDGTPYILEINCNPDISQNAGFFRAAEASGKSYKDMVLKILTNARRFSDEYNTPRRNQRWPRHFKNHVKHRFLFS